MAVNAGGVYVDLGLNSARFQEGLKGAGKQLSAFGKQASNIGNSLGEAFSGLAGAAGLGGVGIAGIFAGARDAAADLANISAEAKRAGIGVEVFQELGFAAQKSRVGIDALTDGIKELQLRADEFIVTGAGSGAEAFQRLGFNAAELKEALKDPAALFEEIINRLGKLDTASQIRVSDELFGGTGGEQFLRFLDQGNGAIARMRQEARDTGAVLSSDVIDKAVEIDRQFNIIATTISTNVKGAIVEVAALMKDFAGTFSTLIKVASGDAVAAAQRIAQLQGQIQKAAASFGAGSPTFNAVTGGMQKELAGLQANFANASASGGIGSDARSPVVNPPQAPRGQGDLSNVGAAAKAAKDLAASYDQIIASANERITQQQTELTTTGMATAAAEAYRLQQDLINEAARAGINLTPQQTAQIAALAEQYGAAAAATEKAREKQEALEQSIADAKGLTTDFASGLVNDLRSGVDEIDALENALGRLEQQLIDMAVNALIQKLFSTLLAAPLGGGTPIGMGGIGHAATGGKVVGPGSGTSDSAGLFALSNGEHVIKASQAKKHRALLDAINNGTITKMASGGPVGRSSSSGGAAGSGKIQPIINVTNNSREDVQAQTRDDGTTEIIIGTVQQGMSAGRFNSTMRGTFGTGNARIRRGAA